MGFGSFSFSMPSIAPKVPTKINIGVPNIPKIPPISYGGSTTPNIGIPNIPATTGSGLTSLLTKGMDEWVEAGLDELGDQTTAGLGKVKAFGDKIAQAGMKAFSGTGMYADEEPDDPPGPGPTGFEAATRQSTLLTGQRKKGAGRSAHSGRGSASTV